MAKEELIEEQTQIILSLLRKSVDRDSFNTELEAIPKLKLEALENALKISRSERLSSENIETLNIAVIDKRIGDVKDRPLARKGLKADGMSAGTLVTKLKSPEEELTAKHNTIWVKKQGRAAEKDDDDIFDGKGEVVCEYIGTNLANLVLTMDSLSPKVRLHQESDQITLMSKYLHSFKTIQDFKLEAARDRKKIEKFNLKDQDYQGFGSIFAASYLVGDPDVNAGNIGFIEINGGRFLARIDFGKALSYNAHLNNNNKIDADYVYDNNLQSVDDYKNDILKFGTKASPLYDSKMFKGLEFAAEVAEVSTKINENEIKIVLDRSIDNLEKAYGTNFLNDPEISFCLRRRMGFENNKSLSEATFKEKIVSNIMEQKVQLREMARKAVEEIFPQHSDKALDTYIASSTNVGVDYVKFIQIMSSTPSPIDFNDSKQFKKRLFK
jgi:hypothetical protein